MYSFWKKTALTFAAVGGGLLKTITENSWLFTAIPLSGEDESNAGSKFFYFLAQLVVYETLYAGLGYVIHRQKKEKEASLRKSNESKEENPSSSFWKKNLFTLLTPTIAGVAKTLSENSWLITQVPLQGESKSNVASKIPYFIAQLIADGVLYGEIGHLLDLTREPKQDENTPLLSLQVK